ncbi:Uncharacterised protein [Chromobacterium violaceum]|uniref:Uncharacterized protein n=1 Tax=Chromobacterium violaceum TaxID=536 RepID=A0A3S4LJF5_CHRVL|nr:Uncharacterised protein [Chromobacterium violaceum]
MLLAQMLGWLSSWRLPLAVAGCVYLLWLSWQIARSGQPEAREQAGRWASSARRCSSG